MNGLAVAVRLFLTPQLGPFLIGRTLAATAAWMERIALGWMMWDATASATMVGLLVFVRLVPGVVLGPWGGVLADRSGSMTVLTACYLGAIPVALGAAALAGAGQTAPAILLAIGAVGGALQSIANGPMKAAISEIAPRELLATAIPVASITFNFAAFVGSAIAGGLIAVLGEPLVFLCAAAGYGCFSIFIPRVARISLHTAEQRNGLGEFHEAVAFAIRDKTIGPMFVLHFTFSLLLRPMIDLLPAVAGRLVGGGAEALALLASAMGLGAVSGSLWLTWRSTLPGLPERVLKAAVLACVAAFILGLSQSHVMVAGAFALLGAALVIRAAGANTIVQLSVEDRYRGRVMAAWGTILRLGAAIGGILLGALADTVGMRAAILLASTLSIVCLLVVSGKTRNGPTG